MSAEHAVLHLQRLDSEADQLTEERAGLPERASLEANLAEDLRLESSRSEAGERLEVLRRDERGVEAQVADIAARAKGFEEDLYSGRVTVPKELETLQAELSSCQAKQAEMEEAELELMERGEAIEAEIAAIDTRHEELESSSEALRADIAAQEERIDGELARLEQARGAVTPEIAADLLTAYEKLRGVKRLAGIVISHLVENACGTCRTVLPIAEVSRIKAAGSGSYSPCPACQRLILR